MNIILLVAFVIICILLVCLVLLQNEDGGMGGAFGGAGSQAFGSRSASVLTKTTYVFVTLFFVTSFVLALLTKAPVDKALDQKSIPAENGAVQSEEWWKTTNGDVAPTEEVKSVEVDTEE